MAQKFASSQGEEAELPVPPTIAAPQTNTDALDSLLDEIDASLQVNAAEFVRSFVQKGGQ